MQVQAALGLVTERPQSLDTLTVEVEFGRVLQAVKIHPPKKFPSSSNWYVIMLLLDDDPTQCTFASTTFCKWTPSG
jgi:hypothetical protein